MIITVAYLKKRHGTNSKFDQEGKYFMKSWSLKAFVRAMKVNMYCKKAQVSCYSNNKRISYVILPYWI